MSWTFEKYIAFVMNAEDFLSGEVVVEFGDIKSDSGDPTQKEVVLYVIEKNFREPRKADLFRVADAWDYAQQWADRSGRPVRLRVNGEREEEDSRIELDLGIKTFQPRISGGTATEPFQPRHEAYGSNPATGLMKSVKEYGTWYVPYSDTSARRAAERIDAVVTLMASLFAEVVDGFGQSWWKATCTCAYPRYINSANAAIKKFWASMSPEEQEIFNSNTGYKGKFDECVAANLTLRAATKLWRFFPGFFDPIGKGGQAFYPLLCMSKKEESFGEETLHLNKLREYLEAVGMSEKIEEIVRCEQRRGTIIREE